MTINYIGRMNIPEQLLSAFGDNNKITTDDLFDAAVTRGLILNNSGSLRSKGKRLSQLLCGWNIRPRSIRFGSKVANGYLKSQFVWAIKTGQPIAPDFTF